MTWKSKYGLLNAVFFFNELHGRRSVTKKSYFQNEETCLSTFCKRICRLDTSQIGRCYLDRWEQVSVAQQRWNDLYASSNWHIYDVRNQVPSMEHGGVYCRFHGTDLILRVNGIISQNVYENIFETIHYSFDHSIFGHGFMVQ